MSTQTKTSSGLRMSGTPEKLLTLDEVADRLRISRESARRLCVSGKLAFVNVGSGSDREVRRVRSDTLTAFMSNERKAAITQQISDVRRMRLVSESVEQWL